MEAELLVLRSGRWSVKRPSMVCHHSADEHVLPPPPLSSWKIGTVLPLLDMLCWADKGSGLLFCNVLDESPVLRYVPLQAEAAEPAHGPRSSSRKICVTGSGGTVKFVSVVPRCCCCGAGATHCQRSRHAYTINTWTLSVDDMVWVMDAMVDATELWALDVYKGIPRVPLLYPIVSLDDDPHVICFLVCEWFFVKHRDSDQTGFLIIVDTRNKTILSVYSQPDDGLRLSNNILPSRISYYLNLNYNATSNGKCSSSVKNDNMEMALLSSSPAIAVDELAADDADDSGQPSSTMSADEPAMRLSEILAVFREIETYGLDRDEMLKAYSVLSEDSGRRFTSLLRLPKNLRKDWLLMEIKTATEV
ncbi:hypothetical protein BS78_05G079300 [Paspalum vaginatum]|nr:hypothetical protein BS78_05G079300 [Paspalum vaginatum]